MSQLAGSQTELYKLGYDIASGVILIRVDYERVNHVELVVVATSSQVFWHRHLKSQQRARLNAARQPEPCAQPGHVRSFSDFLPVTIKDYSQGKVHRYLWYLAHLGSSILSRSLLYSAGWQPVALRGFTRISIPLTLPLWDRAPALYSAGWGPLARRALERISIPVNLRLWDRAIGPGGLTGFIHLSLTSTRESSKGFLDPSECRAQLPVHYAI